MKKLSNKKNYVIFLVGALIFIAGLVLVYITSDMEDITDAMKASPFLFIGVGSGIFGSALGNIIRTNKLNKNDEKYMSYEVEKNDERNMQIRDKAKAKGYDVMVCVFGAVLLYLTLASTKLSTILVVVGAYVICCGSVVYFIYKYSKEL